MPDLVVIGQVGWVGELDGAWRMRAHSGMAGSALQLRAALVEQGGSEGHQTLDPGGLRLAGGLAGCDGCDPAAVGK